MAAFIMDHPSSIRLNLPFSLTQTAPPLPPPRPWKKGTIRRAITLRWQLLSTTVLCWGTWPSRRGWRFRRGQGTLSATSCRSCWHCCRSSWGPSSCSQQNAGVPTSCWRWWRWTCPWWGWGCSWHLPSTRCWASWTEPSGLVSMAGQSTLSRMLVTSLILLYCYSFFFWLEKNLCFSFCLEWLVTLLRWNISGRTFW